MCEQTVGVQDRNRHWVGKYIREPRAAHYPQSTISPGRGTVFGTIYVSFLDPFFWSPTESERMDGSVRVDQGGQAKKSSLLRGPHHHPCKNRHVGGQLWRQAV